MTLYLLFHDGPYDSCIIGFYTSYQLAEKIKKQYCSIEGFKDYQDYFLIEEYEIDNDNIEFEN